MSIFASPPMRWARRRGGFWVAILIIGVCGVLTAKADVGEEVITLVVGRSTVVVAPWPTVRIAVTDPTVANVQVLTPEQVLVQGLKIGSTDIILWSEDEQKIWQKRVVVKLDVEGIHKILQTLFPTAELKLSDSGQVLLVQGLLRSTNQAEQLHLFLERAKIEYVDMTSVTGVQQVQLQVRVAEVSRDAIRQLGMSWFYSDEDFFFGQTSADLADISIGVGSGPSVDDNLDWVFLEDVAPTAAVTVFGGFPDADLSLFLNALAENGYLRILANPSLVALSGEQANFLAGGEFPVPIAQSGAGGGSATITIEWKKFGVDLTFLPVVLGDGGIRLRTMQEVSQLSDAGAVEMSGTIVPALITRRAETTLELKSGQSFAMAGLLQRVNRARNSRLPLLGDLPVIGPLFRSVRYQEDETELVMLVTASLVEPFSSTPPPPLPGVTHNVPTDWELYVEGRLESKEPAKLDPTMIQWMKDMGLSELIGPGAWAAYEDNATGTNWQGTGQETSEQNTETEGTKPESGSHTSRERVYEIINPKNNIEGTESPKDNNSG